MGKCGKININQTNVRINIFVNLGVDGNMEYPSATDYIRLNSNKSSKVQFKAIANLTAVNTFMLSIPFS